MYQRTLTAIGSMSGTSLDGLDLCLATFFQKGEKWSHQIHHSTTIAYPQEWQKKLASAPTLNPQQLKTLDAEFGHFMGQAIFHFLADCHFNEPIDLIANHGHTVYHQPEQKLTLQIGNGPEVRNLTGITTVCDFRVQDVMLGGQGAPLVPMGDELLFNDYSACVNLGGFANISMRKQNQRIAFDVCPVNIVLNALATRLNQPYDDGGTIAQSGHIIPSLFDALNGLAFYDQKPPKSLGREWVETHIFPLFEDDFSTRDVIRTFTEHVAFQLSRSISDVTGNVLITGGGAYNTFLLSLLKKQSNTQIIHPEKLLIEQKEALIFAFLGVLRWSGLPNCLGSVTGAFANHSSGRIWRV